jgi:hypothetical protein
VADFHQKSEGLLSNPRWEESKRRLHQKNIPTIYWRGKLYRLQKRTYPFEDAFSHSFSNARVSQYEREIRILTDTTAYNMKIDNGLKVDVDLGKLIEKLHPSQIGKLVQEFGHRIGQTPWIRFRY